MRLKKVLAARGIKQAQLIRIVNNDSGLVLRAHWMSLCVNNRYDFHENEIEPIRKALQFLGVGQRMLNAIPELKERKCV